MKLFRMLAGAFVIAVVLSTPVVAQTTVYSAGDATNSTYMDYMKTVYARGGNPKII